MYKLSILILVAVGSCQGARILGIFPTASISHQFPFQAVMKAMASRGHQVTVLSPNPLKKPHANYTDIDLSFTYDFIKENADPNLLWDITPYQLLNLFAMMSEGTCHLQLSSNVVQDFIKTNPKFDLVYIEALMYQCMYGLLHHVGSPPLVGLLSLSAMSTTNEATGNPWELAYVPDSLWAYTDHMTFLQRANNVIYTLYSKYKWGQNMHNGQEAIMRQYFGGGPPSVWETEKNFSLIMIGNHWSLGYPRPMVPTIIELGTLHVQESSPLPKDLKEFLDGAKDGFIYFSLGSNVRSDKLPEDKRRAFLEAFAELPQRVLWKWESDTLPGQPGNVKLGKWLPQQDILTHPKIQLFITQGGLQSMQEATDNAVPLLVLPFIGDQKYNAKKVVGSGVGLELDSYTLSKETILTAIREVITNSSYRANMKRVSAIVKDQPETPLERAVWWSEYVLRHNGAPHLRSAALDLAWYQHTLLDVIALIAVVILMSLSAVYCAVKKLCKLLARTNKCKHDKVKKSN